MTTRLKGLTVAFSHDIREDNAQAIIDAIQMIKGVMDVQPVQNTADDWIIESRIKSDLRQKIFEIFK